MSWRTTGILFVIVVLLGAIAFLQSERGDPETPTPAPAFTASDGATIFGDSQVDDVTRLEISGRSDLEASFLKENEGSWHMAVPTSTVVISQTVTSAISGLLSAGSRRTFARGENPLEVYGLLDPAREIVLAATRGEQVVRYRLQIGHETPAGDAYYVLKEGDDRVHLLAKSTLDAVFALATNPPLPETG